MSTPNVQTACATLKRGGVIAYPTEAVWGLGCDPGNRAAIERLLDIKRRPREKGLILVAATMQQIQKLLSPLSQEQRATLAASWPGPITWLIPDPDRIFSNWVKGDHNSVAIRVSAHPVVQQLCEGFGGPIVSTSANRTGAMALKDRAALTAEFADEIDYIVDGELGDGGAVSEIRELLSGTVIR